MPDSALSVHKFPSLQYRNKSLLWDIRQKLSPPEILFIPTDFPPPSDVQAQLRARQPQEILLMNRREWGLLWSAELGHPSSQMRVWGVTGTNGKTTTCALLRAGLLALGESVVEIGTLGLSHWTPQNI